MHVTPGSKTGTRVEPEDNPNGTMPALRVRVAARATDGAANVAVIAAVAAYLGVPKSSINIHRGNTSRTKVIRIAGE